MRELDWPDVLATIDLEVQKRLSYVYNGLSELSSSDDCSSMFPDAIDSIGFDEPSSPGNL
jgi:hypothetical protein